MRRDDSFGPKIVEIGAILAIFRPFEIFQKKSLPWTVNHISKIIRELNPQPQMTAKRKRTRSENEQKRNENEIKPKQKRNDEKQKRNEMKMKTAPKRSI